MPGTHPEMTIPASAPGESTPLAAKAPITETTTTPAVMASRKESVVLKSEEKKSETAALKRFAEDGGHFSLVRNFRVADVVTLMNGFCGAMSLFSSANYLLTSDPTYLNYALGFPLAGMFFDFLDGRVARWRNESSMLGQELDSLADSISFGVAPALLAFCIGMRTVEDTVVLSGFVCCGIARLARFNSTVAYATKDATGKAKFFEGLPIPSTLILVSGMYELVRRDWIQGPGGKGEGLPLGLIQGLPFGLALHWVTLSFAVWGTMMVSKTFKVVDLYLYVVPKP